MVNKLTRRADRRDIVPGDVVRWGSGGRWALVVETDDRANGLGWRLMWAFGAAAGDWVDEEDRTVDMPGWVDPRTNGHSLATANTVIVKDRADAAKDAARLGWSRSGHKLDSPSAWAVKLLRELADRIERGDMIKWEITETNLRPGVETTFKTITPEQVRP